VGPSAGLDDMEKLKLFTLPGLEFQPLASSKLLLIFILSLTQNKNGRNSIRKVMDTFIVII
jgi:hypothetical protein